VTFEEVCRYKPPATMTRDIVRVLDEEARRLLKERLERQATVVITEPTARDAATKGPGGP